MSREREHSHTVREKEAGVRLDQLLAELEPVHSRSFAQKLIARDLVRVNGEIVSKRHIVRPGERITFEIPPAEPSELEPEAIPLDIRFEDEHLIVLSKPAGLVVHPAQGHWSGTLVHALLAHSRQLGSLAGDDRPGIVHRLDKDTTGLMMVAKTDAVQAALSDAIKIRAVSRRYITLVHGYIASDTGLVDGPIARHPKDRMRMAVVDSPQSRQAVTSFGVLERFTAGTYDDGFTLVECRLHTGRTHQVRVHMAFIDHPVVGDQLYGRRNAKADLGLRRQFLHAYRITFEHPVTGETVDLTDRLPEDLRAVLDPLADLSMGRTAAGDEVLGLLESVPASGSRLS
ncbi:MAG: RluA family pseudouridine synthase [Coriobacteriaceae bacterium]|nr:RluA family pseudouridine synthase [Coriobacteriaceae bacterium]